MKRLICYISLIVILLHPGYTQFINVTDNAYRDSLKTELFIAEQDTSIVQLLNALAESYWVSKYDSGIFYAKNGLLIARQNNYTLGEVNSLLTLALVSSVIGDVVRGYEYSSMAIALAKKLDNDALLGQAYTAYGEVLASTEKYNEAIEAIKNALFVTKDIPTQLTTNYAQMADWYEKLSLSDSADHYANLAYETMTMKALNTPYPLRIIANMHRRLGDYERALDFYLKSVTSASEYRDDVSLAMAYLDLSQLYQRSGQEDSTFHYAKLALKSAERSRSTTLIIQASNYLSELYTPIDKEQALKYAMKSNATKDSLKRIIQEQAIQSFDDFDLKLRELEIEQAKKVLNAKIRQNSFLGSTFLLLIIAFALYRNNRVKQKGKQKVENAFEKLKATQQRLIYAEKMASLGEITAGIAHEIQNPLNFVNNFSELNIELMEDIEELVMKDDKVELLEVIKGMKSNEWRIVHHGKRAEEIVRSMLEHSRNETAEKELTDINALADECLSLSFHGIRAKDDAFKSNFQLVSDPNLPKTTVVRKDIGKVLLNLISNAFHAVAERAKTEENGYKPYVEVITKSTDDTIEITIKDNGPGIPEDIKDKIFQPFFTTKPTGVGTGLGLSLSYDIITKGHEGTIEVGTSTGGETEFSIHLPIK